MVWSVDECVEMWRDEGGRNIPGATLSFALGFLYRSQQLRLFEYVTKPM